MRRAPALAAALALLLAGAAAARDVPPARFPLRDDADLLDGSLHNAIRRLCVDLERDTGAELAVLIVRSAGGDDPRRFGLRVFNVWGVGKRGLDNGVLLLFAMEERRVELIAGLGYEDLFTEASSSSLLQETVVPRMRAGEPGEAILTGVRAVAYRMREHEQRLRRFDLLPERPEATGFGGGAVARLADLSAPAPARSAPARSAPASPLGASPRPRAHVHDFLRVLALLVLLGWGGFLYYALSRTFSTGQLVVGKGALYAVAILVPLAVGGGLAHWNLTHPTSDALPDVILGVAGLIGCGVACTCASHICPRCNRWMSIRSRTLVYATYHSSGTGERTEHCRHCRYHRVYTYRIPRKTQSSSSSSSSWSSSTSSSSRSFGGGSSSSSSFGGGASRGGGGGASW
ncbi:MAG: TPM domain-containing protein [Planctomycetes bacterium]|nr:TPM domain-containing protein [Planctomycetota bacterium]